MSRLFEVKKAIFGHGWIECFDSADEVVRTCKSRQLNTAAGFTKDEQKHKDPDFTGVKSWYEACELMRSGYQPSVDKLKTGIKANVTGQAKRVSFFNDVVGFSPIVPLALQGVPTSMCNSRMTPIKAKVIDVYYDMTVSCYVKKEDLQKAGELLLGAILDLEMQGYKFNLFAIQSYSEKGNFDMLCTKIKSSNTPLDLRKISFPLTHPGYFRSIGFDWYSRMPKAKKRCGYGHGLAYDYDDKKLTEGFREIFGKNVVAFSAERILKKNTEYLKNVLTATGSNKEE